MLFLGDSTFDDAVLLETLLPMDADFRDVRSLDEILSLPRSNDDDRPPPVACQVGPALAGYSVALRIEARHPRSVPGGGANKAPCGSAARPPARIIKA
jgi:hypothetical protein